MLDKLPVPSASFIMTAEGHLIFSVACAIFAKKAELTPALAHGDWWHIIPGALLTCLWPDIDHPKSVLGQRLKWLSSPIARYAHPCRCSSTVAHSLALPVADTQFSERQSARADLVHVPRRLCPLLGRRFNAFLRFAQIRKS